jgi:hypothetical protein
MSNATEAGVADIPYIMVSKSNDHFFTIAAVHPQFFFFTCLIVSSCFAVTTFTFPWGDVHFFSMGRVILVHVWNLLGLIAIIVVYTSYTQWGIVPLSNFFYSIGIVGLTWLYCYWHMVDSTNSWLNTKRDTLAGVDPLKYMEVKSPEDDNEIFDKEESYTVRKNITQEMSLSFPLFFASTLLQGNAGMDQWRLQTVFFASWAFFAFYGIFYRFKEAHDTRHHTPQKAQGATATLQKPLANAVVAGAEGGEEAEPSETPQARLERLAATNAMAFIFLGIIVVYIQVILALGTRILFSSQRFPYFTDALNSMKVGQFFLLLTMTLLLADAGRIVLTTNIIGVDNASVTYRFGGNMVVITTGSILVKILYFLALSNSDAWTMIA